MDSWQHQVSPRGRAYPVDRPKPIAKADVMDFLWRSVTFAAALKYLLS